MPRDLLGRSLGSAGSGRSSPAWWSAAWIGLALTGPIANAVATLTPPATVEVAYSQGIGLRLAAMVGRLPGLVAFSVAEAATPLLALGLLALGVRARRRAPSWRTWLARILLPTAALALANYALFVAVWGLNYRRLPIADSLDLDVANPTVEELRALTEESLSLANTTRAAAPEDADGVATLIDDVVPALHRASTAYVEARDILPGDPRFRPGQFSEPKPLRSSLLFSYLRISGIYIPFTGEPNVNVDGPRFGLPFSACHELAHQRGIAREDEANFIAWTVGRQSRYPDYAYSAAYVGLMYTLNALADVDPEGAEALRKGVSPAVERDIAAKRRHLARTESEVAMVSESLNHGYLRANGVSDGVESYGRVVDLMIAHRRRGLDTPP